MSDRREQRVITVPAASGAAASACSPAGAQAEAARRVRTVAAALSAHDRTAWYSTDLVRLRELAAVRSTPAAGPVF